jgi:O-acetyl-ADP-ribose deacetylase (regulator of RNase III)
MLKRRPTVLKIVEGDLWKYAKGPCVIAHGCNPLGKMGAGFAKAVCDKFPFNFLEYRHWCLNNRLKLGQWLMVYEQVLEDGVPVTKGVFNLITQETFGNDPSVVYVDYEAVQKGLSSLAKFNLSTKTPIHMPFIGAGLANGDPKRLMGIFEEVFAEADCMLYLKANPKR